MLVFSPQAPTDPKERHVLVFSPQAPTDPKERHVLVFSPQAPTDLKERHGLVFLLKQLQIRRRDMCYERGYS